MFVTIWMWTHEWSLISMRTTALMFAACHHAFSCLSALTRSTSVRRLRFAAHRHVDPHLLDRLAGVSRVSRSASSETGCSIRSGLCRAPSEGPSPRPVRGAFATSASAGCVWLARFMRRLAAQSPYREVYRPRRAEQLVVRALLDDLAVLQHDDQVGVADRGQPVRDDERRPAREQQPQRRARSSARCRCRRTRSPRRG